MERKTKQVIVIRRDLKVRRGKECAQSGHASMWWLANRWQEWHGAPWWKRLIWLFKRKKPLNQAEEEWLLGSFKKVVCQVDSEEKLLEVLQKAKDKGILACLVTDNGLTEFNGVPTNTAVAVGPAWEDEFQGVTDDLLLY